MSSKIRNQKCKNHEVSKCLLINWLDTSVEPFRIHYFDLEDYQQKFELGKRANFATTRYIYTPFIASGGRHEEFEDWLSVDETGMGLLAKAALHHSPDILPSDGKFISRAIRACIALGCRNAYSFYMLAQIPGLPDMLNVDSVHQALITNSMNTIKRKFAQFSHWDFSVLYKLSDSLIINEQPFRDWTARAKDPIPLLSMPLAPDALLLGQPPKEKGRRHMQLAWISAPDRPNLVKLHNQFMVETAREWVVGASANAISAVAHDLSEDRVQQRRATDRHVLVT
jgi:hypothetical protein